MSPVARADIVAFADMESPGRSKKSVDGPNISALFAPAENERLIIRVGQPTTTPIPPSMSEVSELLAIGMVADMENSGPPRKSIFLLLTQTRLFMSIITEF